MPEDRFPAPTCGFSPARGRDSPERDRRRSRHHASEHAQNARGAGSTLEFLRADIDRQEPVLADRPLPLENHYGPLVSQLPPERSHQLSASLVALLQFKIAAIPMHDANCMLSI